MSDNKQKLVGFAGWPDEKILTQYRDQGAKLVDLDNLYPDVPAVGSNVMPMNTCAIIKRIVANGLAMPLEAIVIDDGPGKCDMARMAAYLIEENTNVEVVRARNDNIKGSGTPVCDSTLAPREKAERILDGLTENVATEDLVYEPDPPAAIWGVPAADLTLYELFPPGTRLLGWFRCLENRTPSLEELELETFPGVATVFFAQTFCHKNIMARHLANTHEGLYLDADGIVTASVRAKIEAFLKFNAKKIKGSL